ncbi:restriction endonuclease subunit S [Enterococcus faecium]|uniref:restriction endonuclease subunit S n=1 Tax=Enterococcus faecium TaxID=1352 RepID=UPI000F516599|nr:restriction endonuclease subunit S [Enterococcus faecium]ROX99742.1 restriction endonuclease subunit S [Enterococcus faecium]
MSNNTQPEIRFPGFTDDWEQRKLADLAEYYDGTHQTPKYTKSGVPFVSVENINNIKRTDKYISEEDFENQFKIKPQKDDILMTRITAGVIGDTTIVPDNNPLAYYVSLALIRPKKIMASYLEKYIGSNQFKEELHKRIIHTAFPKKINLGEIGQCIVSCPCNDSEQEKIGSFFKQLDKTITLHQRKLDLLKETKKGFLQKMFPKNGAKVPEIRFPGFTEDWEQRTLGDILKEFSIKSKVENEYTVLSSTNSGMEIRNGRVSGVSNLGYKIIENGDLVLSPQNLWLGNININNVGTGLVSPSYKTFKFIKVDPGFIRPQLRTARMLEEYKNSSTQGASVVRRNLELGSFYQITIKIPSDVEQGKIGLFFKQLDNLIALHQRKLDLLKETKKGFLQKMFV